MSQQKTSSLKTYFDELEETNGDDECKAWLSRAFDSKVELAAFVAGSFNMSFRFSFDDGRPDVIIRFPKPGHTATAYRDEKIVNEVEFMEYLRQHTDIPIPRVHSWGLTAESPQRLGPFIIMDYVDGTLLSTILKQPDQEDMVLNQNVNSTTLDKIYDQITSYMFQLSRLTFTGIGTISRDRGSSATWNVAGRPLTYNMNELATVAGYPVEQFPNAPFDRASDFLRSVANEHLTHLRTQRNLADDAEIAQQRFIARHRFAQLISKYYPEDCGLSIPFCDDMRPSKMLVDPETLQITAVLDFEYTNSMPAELTYDPPWWLLLSGPEMWLEHCAMDEFVTLYEPRMEQFLRASNNPVVDRLSLPVCDSWRTGRFWFDYAARKSFDVDTIYWAALHNGDDDAGVELLDDKARAEMELFTQTKMEQLKAYKEECTARFSSET
ncbi:hypothetical protein P168DRAFT_309811 [Aspergillus campestris IBT 28561]|uniref:Aminoglycoside phosphotransferase domain-containing protein n=1 Tax=Aspergillus campestris (strain IBT 28561) TaxID=1392248 RepID=A0A2I1D6I5_ASPC2|nr:uncharacterized protein P168DRAFT_309811 [Aspergillus campestris IBT 28561]PKY05494.1 hypothetical protein P168DRAFT_309811 [Aspergillus campestris IBT 28561]